MPLAIHAAAAYTGLNSLVFKGIAMYPVAVLFIESDPDAARHAAHYLRATNIRVDIPTTTASIAHLFNANLAEGARPRVPHPTYRAVIVAETFHRVHVTHLLPALRRLTHAMYLPVIVGAGSPNLPLPLQPEDLVTRHQSKVRTRWYLNELYTALRPYLV